MVRIKYRFVVLKYQFNTASKFTISGTTFIDILKSLTASEYGEYGISRLGTVAVIEVMPAHGYIFFRVLRNIYPEVAKMLEQCKELNGSKVDFKILRVSGCAKSCKEYILKRSSAENSMECV